MVLGKAFISRPSGQGVKGGDQMLGDVTFAHGSGEANVR